MGYTVVRSNRINEADKKLSHSSEMLSAIFDLNPDAIVLTRVSDGKFIDCNQEFLNQIGYSREEVIGHTSLELNLYSSEQRQTYLDKIQKEKTLSNFELRLKRKNGVFIYILYSARLINVNGEQIILNIGNDISERKKAENELYEIMEDAHINLENLEKVLDAVPAGVWIAHDPDGNHITGNKVSYDWLDLPHGSEASMSAVGKERPNTFRMYKEGEELKPEEMPLQKSARGEEISNYEFSIIYPNGSQRHMLGNATPFIDEQGNPKGSVSSFIDITPRKIAEEKLDIALEDLKRSNTELEQFAYVASHDLREPLRMITSFLKLLEQQYKDQLDQNAHKFIEFAVDGAKRLDNMINDLLLYSGINNKKVFNPVNSEQVLEETLLNLKVSIDENNAIITHDLLPIIWGMRS